MASLGEYLNSVRTPVAGMPFSAFVAWSFVAVWCVCVTCLLAAWGVLHDIERPAFVRRRACCLVYDTLDDCADKSVRWLRLPMLMTWSACTWTPSALALVINFFDWATRSFGAPDFGTITAGVNARSVPSILAWLELATMTAWLGLLIAELLLWPFSVLLHSRVLSAFEANLVDFDNERDERLRKRVRSRVMVRPHVYIWALRWAFSSATYLITGMHALTPEPNRLLMWTAMSGTVVIMILHWVYAGVIWANYVAHIEAKKNQILAALPPVEDGVHYPARPTSAPSPQGGLVNPLHKATAALSPRSGLHRPPTAAADTFGGLVALEEADVSFYRPATGVGAQRDATAAAASSAGVTAPAVATAAASVAASPVPAAVSVPVAASSTGLLQPAAVPVSTSQWTAFNGNLARLPFPAPSAEVLTSARQHSDHMAVIIDTTSPAAVTVGIGSSGAVSTRTSDSAHDVYGASPASIGRSPSDPQQQRRTSTTSLRRLDVTATALVAGGSAGSSPMRPSYGAAPPLSPFSHVLAVAAGDDVMRRSGGVGIAEMAAGVRRMSAVQPDPARPSTPTAANSSPAVRRVSGVGVPFADGMSSADSVLVPSGALQDRLNAYFIQVDPGQLLVVPAMLSMCQFGADMLATAQLLAQLHAQYNMPVPTFVPVRVPASASPMDGMQGATDSVSVPPLFAPVMVSQRRLTIPGAPLGREASSSQQPGSARAVGSQPSPAPPAQPPQSTAPTPPAAVAVPALPLNRSPAASLSGSSRSISAMGSPQTARATVYQSTHSSVVGVPPAAAPPGMSPPASMQPPGSPSPPVVPGTAWGPTITPQRPAAVPVPRGPRTADATVGNAAVQRGAIRRAINIDSVPTAATGGMAVPRSVAAAGVASSAARRAETVVRERPQVAPAAALSLSGLPAPVSSAVAASALRTAPKVGSTVIQAAVAPGNVTGIRAAGLATPTPPRHAQRSTSDSRSVSAMPSRPNTGPSKNALAAAKSPRNASSRNVHAFQNSGLLVKEKLTTASRGAPLSEAERRDSGSSVNTEPSPPPEDGDARSPFVRPPPLAESAPGMLDLDAAEALIQSLDSTATMSDIRMDERSASTSNLPPARAVLASTGDASDAEALLRELAPESPRNDTPRLPLNDSLGSVCVPPLLASDASVAPSTARQSSSESASPMPHAPPGLALGPTTSMSGVSAFPVDAAPTLQSARQDSQSSHTPNPSDVFVSGLLDAALQSARASVASSTHRGHGHAASTLYVAALYEETHIADQVQTPGAKFAGRRASLTDESDHVAAAALGDSSGTQISVDQAVHDQSAPLPMPGMPVVAAEVSTDRAAPLLSKPPTPDALDQLMALEQSRPTSALSRPASAMSGERGSPTERPSTSVGFARPRGPSVLDPTLDAVPRASRHSRTRSDSVTSRGAGTLASAGARVLYGSESDAALRPSSRASVTTSPTLRASPVDSVNVDPARSPSTRDRRISTGLFATENAAAVAAVPPAVDLDGMDGALSQQRPPVHVDPTSARSADGSTQLPTVDEESPQFSLASQRDTDRTGAGFSQGNQTVVVLPTPAISHASSSWTLPTADSARSQDVPPGPDDTVDTPLPPPADEAVDAPAPSLALNGVQPTAEIVVDVTASQVVGLDTARTSSAVTTSSSIEAYTPVAEPLALTAAGPDEPPVAELEQVAREEPVEAAITVSADVPGADLATDAVVDTSAPSSTEGTAGSMLGATQLGHVADENADQMVPPIAAETQRPTEVGTVAVGDAARAEDELITETPVATALGQPVDVSAAAGDPHATAIDAATCEQAEATSQEHAAADDIAPDVAPPPPAIITDSVATAAAVADTVQSDNRPDESTLVVPHVRHETVFAGFAAARETVLSDGVVSLSLSASPRAASPSGGSPRVDERVSDLPNADDRATNVDAPGAVEDGGGAEQELVAAIPSGSNLDDAGTASIEAGPDSGSRADGHARELSGVISDGEAARAE